MKRKFLKSAAVALVVTLAFSGLPLSAYSAETDAYVAESVVESATVDNNTPEQAEPATQESTQATEATETTNPPVADYPKVTGFANTANGTKVSWSEYSGAAKYTLFVFDGTKWRRVGDSTKLNYTHTSLNNGTTYIYTVRALDKNNKFISDYSRQGYANTFYAPPAVSKLENVYGGVNVKWNGNSGINSYRIYRKTNNSSWHYIGDAYGTSYLDKSAVSGMNYTYTVRCMDSNGKLVSSYNSGKSITYVKSPSISKIENTVTGSKISWSKCSGAAKYRVFYLDSSKKWRSLGATASTSFTHDKLKTGTTYTYTVRCLDSKGNFASGFIKSGKSNLFLEPPTISSVSKADKGNLVKWNSVSGVAGYRLYRRTAGKSWSVLADITLHNSYVDTSAKKDNVYSYTLRCIDKNGNLISSYISDTKYYYNGSLANGKVSANGETYYFSNGLFRSGLQTINGNKYYYNSSGVLQKNGIVGSAKDGWYYADKNGVCCESEEIRLAANYMMKYCKGNTLDGKMKSGFLYMAKNFSYKRSYDHPKGASDLAPLAVDLFKNKKGNCFRYAAGFACVARIAGYRSRVVIGTTAGSPHGWTEVLVNGEWLICDPDAQLPGYNVPDYTPYMMKKHYWQITPRVKCEVTIENGKAVWK